MFTRVFIISFYCLLFFSITSFAQKQTRSEKLYLHAQWFKSKKKNDQAISTMLKAIRADATNAEAYASLGEWYATTHNYKSAADVFSQAIIKCKHGGKRFNYAYAQSLLQSGLPNDALQVINQNAADTNWESLKRQALYLKTAMQHPRRDSLWNMGPRINTKDAEMYPQISSDGQTFYFTRRVHDIDQDFFYATPDSCGGWFTAQNMGAPPNSVQQEAAQMISADNHYLFFMRCDNRTINGWDRGGCDLYMSYRVAPDSAWTPGQSFGATINTPGFEGMPSISPDNRELYFVSNRPGGYGGLDIWVTRFERGLWQEPRNLGPAINTPGDEVSPFLHSDNQTLCFASNGRPGLGGYDLYLTHKINDTAWEEPKNLGYPINTQFDENSITINNAGTQAFLSSNRGGNGDDFDIYQLHWPKEFKPKPVGFLKGYVYDSLTKKPLNYAYLFVSDSLGFPLYEYQSNKGDGSFMMNLPAGKTYIINIDRMSYTNVIDTIHNVASTVDTPTFQNYSMLPLDYEKPLNDTTILSLRFLKNSKELNDSERNIIDSLIKPWVPQAKNINGIFINAYTDDSGTPMLNEQLSYLRAKLVRDALLKNGLQDNLLTAKGWAEANPLVPNTSEENRNANRRVDVIIRR